MLITLGSLILANISSHGVNPARWRGHLDKMLATPGKVAKIEHHLAMDYSDVGAFMVDLAGMLFAARGLPVIPPFPCQRRSAA